VRDYEVTTAQGKEQYAEDEAAAHLPVYTCDRRASRYRVLVHFQSLNSEFQSGRVLRAPLADDKADDSSADSAQDEDWRIGFRDDCVGKT
jgi:hypothetical protein